MRLMMILKFEEELYIMGNMKLRSAGRPKLVIDKELLEVEIEKYINGQTAVKTYRNLGIGKTSFYRLLSQMEVTR